MKSSDSLSHPVIVLNIQNYFEINSEKEATSSEITPETWEKWFQTWGEIMVSELPVGSHYELTLRLTGDAEIQSLNAQYRYKNQPTDVLAFANLESDFPIISDEKLSLEPLYIGDIIISEETAQQQAQQQGHSLEWELPWLAAHGFLHLLGWDHPDEESLQKMLEQQETLLKIVGL